MELATNKTPRKFFKGFCERFEIAEQRFRRIRIHHPSLTTGSCAFHFHSCWFAGDPSFLQCGSRESIGFFYPGSSKWPAGTGRHVDTNSETLPFASRMFEHLHPPGRQKINVPVLISPGSENGSDLYAADSCSRQLLQLPGNI